MVYPYKKNLHNNLSAIAFLGHDIMSIHTILDQFRETAQSPRDLGDKFEVLMLYYLQTEPFYKDHFSEVWLWMDFPKRGNMPDTGIDLVAVERYTGDYCAIQCKCYDSDRTIEKADIDSFFTASGTNLFKKRMILTTTNKWSKNAESALHNQQIPVVRATIYDLENSPIDWDKYDFTQPEKLALKPKKQIRPHQQIALEKVMKGFENSDRGKLIMACGTGKTFTSLKIAEQFAVTSTSLSDRSNSNPVTERSRSDRNNSLILFLVPSISLLSQTLREWTAESEINFHSIAVCSDTNVGKNKKKSNNDDTTDITVNDLIFPPSTNANDIIRNYRALQDKKELTVIFSTYQSIQAIADAQKIGLPQFDLIICDEAHRTTGVTISGEDESHFVKVHNQDFIKGKKRLYMTATPKIYSDDTKVQAQENDAFLCSMDDEDLYGTEFHRLDFGEAVGLGLLSDYKVMVLAVDEKFVSATFQNQLADANNELQFLNDAAKIIGCWNGLAKRMIDDTIASDDTNPMKRAVAFSNSIKDSQRIVSLFDEIIQQYQQLNPDDEHLLKCQLDHVDGKQNALERTTKLEWLKADTSEQGNICRILSNARCLSEGVDVPALDAVMFLTPRNSVVDVVQSVGRVMRKAEGKKYGYIILPVGIPADIPPEIALKDHQKYKVIWQVLQALRAHDDRFNNTVNKIELNKHRPPQISVIGVGGKQDQEGNSPSKKSDHSYQQLELNFPIEEWRNAIYAKIVVKCGDRRYWEDWAKDVAKIADRHISRIKGLLNNSQSAAKIAFDEFLTGLHRNINPNVTEDEAIEMLSQHLITKPVFDALFEGYEFTKFNPVSQTMQNVLDILEGQNLEKETKTLEKFYQSVRDRAVGIDNAEGKQRIIIELYDKFFRAAFPRLVERLGIVYTPVEVVDFIIKSADFALKQEFGVGLTDEGVHILDPFTGTGTFIVRLLQSGLIKPEDLQRKFTQELHANEIVLLAYYIAAINIEETYHYLSGNQYQPFNGIVLTDTFQMFENEGYFLEKIFPENNQRVINQKSRDITVIIGNPPYSVGQSKANDANQNLKYEKLEKRLEQTYASKGTGKKALYDSYIKAFRWASDRVKNKGIIGFVTNGSFIDKGFADGLRKCLIDEFTNIYCFNLRGFIRGQSGDDAKKEGQNIFNIMTGVAILILIKNPDKKTSNQVFYYDIGDYLTRERKLSIIQNFVNISGIQWETLTPNDNYDWINQRNDIFESFISLGDKKDKTSKTIFDVCCNGVITARDNWVYNFSQNILSENIQKTINFYNQERERFFEAKSKNSNLQVEKFIRYDATFITWDTRRLKGGIETNKVIKFDANDLRSAIYRPFCKQYLYFNHDLIHSRFYHPNFFPDQSLENLVISITGIGARREFSALMVDIIPNLHFHDTCQCFPLYTYEKQENKQSNNNSEQLSLSLDTNNQQTNSEYVKKENIPDTILTEYQKIYKDKTISKEDIFYYIYGVLHSPEYKERFASDLKKMLPRIPYCQDFWTFSKAGKELAYWHLNYETIEPYELKEWKKELYLDAEDYRVEKMVFGKNKNGIDKTTIIYNSKLTLSQIPLETYEYIVNGKSALEWIMERYKFTRDKDSGITNDPNDWSEDPRYIVDLVKRIVRVSLETVKIVKSLPNLNEKNLG